MSLDLRRRLFDELDSLVLDRSAHAHQPARPGVARRWPTSWATTTTPSWPTRPACPRTGSKSPGSTRRRRSAGWSRTSDRSTTRSSTAGSSRCARRSSASQDDRDHAEQLGSAVRRAAERMMAQPDWAEQVLQAEQARSGLPDQRLRRPARRLRHAASTSPACGPTTWSSTWPSRRSASGWRRRTRHRGRATPQRCGSAIGKLFEHFTRARAPGLRHLAAARLLAAARSRRRGPTRRLAAICADGAGAAESHRRAVGNFVFWTLAELCARVRAAVRPDDRRQPRRLRRRASTRGRTCSTAACR